MQLLLPNINVELHDKADCFHSQNRSSLSSTAPRDDTKDFALGIDKISLKSLVCIDIEFYEGFF